MCVPLGRAPQVLEEGASTQEALGKVALREDLEGGGPGEADLVQCGQGVGPVCRSISGNAMLVVKADVVVQVEVNKSACIALEIRTNGLVSGERRREMRVPDIDADAEVCLLGVAADLLKDSVERPGVVPPVLKSQEDSRFPRVLSEAPDRREVRVRGRIDESQASAVEHERASADHSGKRDLVTKSKWIPNPECESRVDRDEWSLLHGGPHLGERGAVRLGIALRSIEPDLDSQAKGGDLTD